MDNKNKHISLCDCRLLLHTYAIIDNLRLFIATYMLPFFLLLNGCINERLDIETDNDNENATLYLNLDIPGLNFGHSSSLIPNNNSGHSPETRFMSNANESSIDYNNIHILVFEEAGQEELFRYKATISSFIPPQITLIVPVSRAYERFRLVVIANANAPYIADGTPKNEALNQFVFDCAGKWNTSGESFSLIPMWGEHSQPFAIKNNTSVNVLMHRALVRVDVGALFKFNNPDPVTELEYPDKETDKESVWGLNNFKIKDIRVYRTLNKAYVASSADKMVVNQIVAPNAPVSAKYNSDSGTGYDDLESADNHPLVYTLPAGSNSYIREIYIPEYLPLDANSSSDNVPSLVVGGYYGETNNTHVTYYRADFASYSNGKVLAYLPLLRNHRYVFDIRSVGSPGYNEPEQALNSIVSDMTLDVKEWNEVPFNYNINGNYYCSIDTREVILDARSSGDAMEVSYAISYKTNLDLDPVSNPLTYKWKSSGNTNNNDFDVIFDYLAKTITIKAKNDNVGIGVQSLSDQIYINVKNYQFTIDVKQKAINAAYAPDCTSVVVHGTYRTDFALNHTNYISMKITSNTTLISLDYEVYTVEKNGIYFAAKGVFDTDGTYTNGVYEYDLKLKGYGTLINESGFLNSFDVMINFNSITSVTCSVGIQAGS